VYLSKIIFHLPLRESEGEEERERERERERENRSDRVSDK